MAAPADPSIVICIPGKWQDREQIASQLVNLQSAFVLNGSRLTDRLSNLTFELEVEAADPRMLEAFSAAGPHWRDSSEMKQIGAHTLVTYLIGKGGSHGRAVGLMQAAAAVVNAGGLGVKIESSGVAHSGADWLRYVNERHLFTAHSAFVVYVHGEDIYSCGMHSLGRRDAVIAIGEADDPVDLLRVFTWYLLTESPAIRPEQVFSVAETQPKYRISAEECIQYEKDELFWNPYGMWRLTRVLGD